MSVTTEHHEPPTSPRSARDESFRQWVLVGLGLTALLSLLGVIVAVFAWAGSGHDGSTARAGAPVAHRAMATNMGTAAASASTAPTPIAQAKNAPFEPFHRVDPTLPAVPAGAVKHFTVGVDEHNVQVDPALAPTQAWTYTVNGKVDKGTAASPPIVVDQGDRVAIRFVNGASKAMHVSMAHSIDFHAAEVAPSKYYVDIAPGHSETIDFRADHPGVFMYHCATQPVLMHVGNGMAGMMVVKPRNLAPVDRELWVTQSEYYLGKPDQPADMGKLMAEKPDVVAFNGYANQYKTAPITVRKGERIRLYVLNEGPSKWSAFHVIGAVFDKAVVENTAFHDSQTMSLAPSQGGYAEFTLNQEGNYPFVTHNFGDMAKGAAGMLHTQGAPMPPKAPATTAPAATTAKADAAITLGDMWVKSSVPSVKAGKVTLAVTNKGATTHGLALTGTSPKLSGGLLAPSSLLDQGKQLSGGSSEKVTWNLKPGTYQLVCFMPGHYAAGQHIPFTVH